MNTQDLKNLLLPGLYCVEGELKCKKRWDLEATHKTIQLVGEGGIRTDLFTPEEVENGNYRGQFRPRVLKIISEHENG